MNWYIAKIVFRIISGDGGHTAQLDEQLRLINAGDENEAIKKASRIGDFEEESFLNHENKLVQWKFIDVSDVRRLDSIKDGIEIYSRVQEEENGRHYTDFVQKKAEFLRTSFRDSMKEPV